MIRNALDHRPNDQMGSTVHTKHTESPQASACTQFAMAFPPHKWKWKIRKICAARKIEYFHKIAEARRCWTSFRHRFYLPRDSNKSALICIDFLLFNIIIINSVFCMYLLSDVRHRVALRNLQHRFNGSAFREYASSVILINWNLLTRIIYTQLERAYLPPIYVLKRNYSAESCFVLRYESKSNGKSNVHEIVSANIRANDIATQTHDYAAFKCIFIDRIVAFKFRICNQWKLDALQTIKRVHFH